MDQNKNISAVRSNNLFKGALESNLQFNFNSRNFIEIGEGEIIYQTGESSDYLYLVIEGEVKLKLPRGFSSPSLTLKNNGDFFGEKEILENCVRKSSAVANKDSLLYKIRKADVNSIATLNQDIMINLSGETKEGIETEANTNVANYDELFEKISETSFFKPENIAKVEGVNSEKHELADNAEINPSIQKNLNDEPISFEMKEEEPEAESESVSAPDLADELNSAAEEQNDNAPINLLNINNDKLPNLISALLKIFSNTIPDEIFCAVSETVAGQLGAEKGMLYIINDDTSEFQTRIKEVTGYSDHTLKLTSNPVAESIYEDKIVSLTSPSKEQTSDIIPAFKEEIRNLIISPIKNTDGRIKGILILVNVKKDNFDSEDKKLLSEISPLIAFAFEKSENTREILHSERLTSLNKIANFLIQDIKSPILSIKQYSEHIKKENVSKEVNLVLEMIVEQSNYVLDIVQTTLGFSEGKLISNPQPILLTTALDYILFMLAEYVESRNVKLFKKYEVDGMVNLDKKEFYQACFQIAKNACDAMPKGGNLYVTTKREGDNILIELKDNGFGIPDSIKEKIFEPFITQGKINRTGLGLAIAEKIIEEHNGVIRAESYPGVGAVFTIVIPTLD
ncbi:MAG: ATP-binding protein [Ignavibacteriaceae bacterium]|nr:ATP-binding protein [Ignavibacteriaceae bacterium]